MIRCDRCGKKIDVTTMSMFNTETICLECEDKEMEHPKYEEARKAEEKAVKRGEFNFRGIGKPSDL